MSPLKRVTLPRLELLGALIRARLGNYLSKNGPGWLHAADETETNTPLPTSECFAPNQIIEDGEDVCSVTEPILKLKLQQFK